MLEFKQNSASSYREDYLDLDNSKLKEEFEDWIKNYKQSNEIKSFEIKNLNEYNKPLKVIIHFENDDTPIPHGNKKIFQLKNFFVDYFEDITEDRKEDVFFRNPSSYIDEIEVLKIPGKKIEFDIKIPGNVYDAEMKVSKGNTGEVFKQKQENLIKTSYNRTETDSSYIFQRVLSFEKKQFSGAKIKELSTECSILNDIQNSSLIISSK
jgi:hypothetical protein